jgi:hypothetical protein
MNPIKKSYAPLYDEVVKQPLYLRTIKNRVRDGVRKISFNTCNALFTNQIVYRLFELLQNLKEISYSC